MTMTSDHDQYLELLAGAVLGGLDDDEARRLEAHRSGCEACAAESRRLAEVTVDLALTSPARAPSSDLGARIAAAVREGPAPTTVAMEPASPATAPSLPVLGAAPRSMWRRRPVFGLIAAALVIVLGVSTIALVTQAEALRGTIASQDAVLALLADPNHRQAPLEAEGDPGVRAMAVYSPGSTQAYVMATGLPATPPDQVYQLWSADDAGVHPLGTFEFDGRGTFVAPFGVDLGEAAAAMVTLEPTGGAQGEPGPQVVFGELAGSET